MVDFPQKLLIRVINRHKAPNILSSICAISKNYSSMSIVFSILAFATSNDF